MTTTLLQAEQELSKQLGDYWSSTATSAGDATGNTIIDTALGAMADDWINTETVPYDFITITGSNQYEERYISQFTATSGTVLLGRVHSAQVANASTYEIHRMFSPSEKRRALIYATRHIYPHCYDRIWDESFVSKNWLLDGSVETWTTTSSLTNWGVSGATLAQISSSPYYVHGSYSAKLSTATGSLYQDISKNDDLKRLAGKNVTFTAQAWSDVSDAVRLEVKDGVNTASTSSYARGASAWTERNPRDNSFYVQHDIADNPTEVTFKVDYVDTSATVYVDDLRVILSNESPRIYIGNLGLEQNNPIEVYIEPSYYSNSEPWTEVHNIEIDYEGGYMYLPSNVQADRRLRIKGYKMLDFLDASGDSSTGWESTINLNQPQLDILIADAAVYLFETIAVPNFDSGQRQEFERSAEMWRGRLRERIGKHGMHPLPVSVKWR